MIRILGLLGRSGHGKTTVARHLAETRGAEIRSLAGPMKRAAKRVFDFTDAQLWGSQADKEAIDPRYGFSPRWLLQRLGTEGLRQEFGEDVHLQALLHAIRRREEGQEEGKEEGQDEGEARRAPPTGRAPRFYVVDDLRFPNDARLIARGGADFRGAVLKIVCSDAPSPTRLHLVHSSEQGIDAVAPEDIAATIVSARVLGLCHLLGEAERVLSAPPWSDLFGPLLPHPPL